MVCFKRSVRHIISNLKSYVKQAIKNKKLAYNIQKIITYYNIIYYVICI